MLSTIMMDVAGECRHCLLNCGPVMTESMWWTAAQAVRRAFDVTLYPLRQLMTPFHSSSENFYGDVGQVKVAVRQDSTLTECIRLQQLARQVSSVICRLPHHSLPEIVQQRAKASRGFHQKLTVFPVVLHESKIVQKDRLCTASLACMSKRWVISDIPEPGGKRLSGRGRLLQNSGWWLGFGGCSAVVSLPQLLPVSMSILNLYGT